MTGSPSWTCHLDRADDGTVTGIAVEFTDEATSSASMIKLSGARSVAVMAPLRQILSDAGIRSSRLAGARPIELGVRGGPQAELLLRAVQPLRRPDRIERVASGVAEMGHEEAAYWHAKASRRGGLRALRIVLDEGNG